MNTIKKVAIIGAGVSGLASIKSCKEENLEVVCYEITHDVGGLWKYREESIPGVASVYKSIVMNTSKEMSVFSDFPAPREFPIYMPHQFAHDYLKLYAEEFSLMSHIRFGRRVTMVKEDDDFETTGRWRITAQVAESAEVEEEVYDAVMVCTGCYSKPSIPSMGQEVFRGKISHTRHYRESYKYRGRKVLIVGSGNSACDVAVDLCGVAEDVYISSRGGAWICPRKGPGGEPWDAYHVTWLNSFISQYLPGFVSESRAENALRQHFDGSLFNLSPKRKFFEAFPTANDLLPFYLLNGSIKVKGRVKRFTPNGVVFEGEENVTSFDDVIFGTGYEVEFPFFENAIHPSELYRNMIPPDVRPTIAFIGFAELLVSFFPLFETQARWFVQVLREKIELPSKKDMKDWITTNQNIRTATYGEEVKKITVLGSYCDELSQDLGIKINFFFKLLSDPILSIKCMNGPLLPYLNRLQGPHPWPGAREAILSYRKRLFPDN